MIEHNGSQHQNHNSALRTAHKGTLLEMRMGAEFVRFQRTVDISYKKPNNIRVDRCKTLKGIYRCITETLEGI
ncbi:unnamed protein product [Prunus armeniaca]|uniref:Uncharacterized protein n=1 Tax=Prunus armeniaca TaxID=36596 RepID=A0A6J5UWT2_PRUAR|nr:unnamed protein product [Prunus armeniaca]CAB4310786.1 unnamed protein product [Prunus armeniaca]